MESKEIVAEKFRKESSESVHSEWLKMFPDDKYSRTKDYTNKWVFEKLAEYELRIKELESKTTTQNK